MGYKTDRYEHVECKPYKGFEIDKSYALDYKGKRIPGTAKYMVTEGDDWVGDVYNTLKEAHQYIDEELANRSQSVNASTQKGRDMIRRVYGTTGRTTSKEYISYRLLKYLCEQPGFEIDGMSGQQVLDRIEALAPTLDVDDVIDFAYDHMTTIPEAIIALEDMIYSEL